MNTEPREELLSALKVRFEKNMRRHPGLEWTKVQARLEAKADKLWSLSEMERTGGEPDLVGLDAKTGETYLTIVQPKARMVAEMFVMTVKRWCKERI